MSARLTLTMDGMDDCDAATLIGILHRALTASPEARERLTDRPPLVATLDGDWTEGHRCVIGTRNLPAAAHPHEWTAPSRGDVIQGASPRACDLCGVDRQAHPCPACGRERDVTRVTCPTCLTDGRSLTGSAR